MNLEKLNSARLTNLEFGQHTKNIYTNITDRGETAPPLHDSILIQYLNDLNLKSQAFDKAMIQITKSDETAIIFHSDELRDRALTCIQRQLSVYEFSPNTNEVLAFASLNTLFSKFKGMQNWNYEKQSNGIDNLIEDLQSDKYSGSAETIKMTEFIERLQTTNNDFKAIFNSRTHEQASKEVFDVKQLRSDLKISYEKLINYVLTMAIATDNQEFNDILSIINTMRKYYSDMIARRKSESKNTAETPTPA